MANEFVYLFNKPHYNSMLTINPNLKNIVFRLVLFIIFSAALYLVVTGLIINGDHKGNAPLYFICAALVLMLANITLSLCGIIKVETDETADKITFSRFFSTKTVSKSAITAYSSSISNSRGGAVYGRIIETMDNTIVELSSINLQDISDIDEFMEKHNIKYLGESRSFYPFSKGL